MTRDDDIHGNVHGGADGEMNYTPEETRAMEAVGRLERPLASADTRERVRDAFLRGGVDPETVVEPSLPFRFHWRQLFPVAVAAALVTALIIGSSPAEHWVVTDVVGADSVVIGDATAAPGVRLTQSAISTGDSSEVDVQLGDDLRFRMLADSKVVLSDPPGRWFGRAVVIHVEAGEIYGTTGGTRPDFALRFETPEAFAEVHGTTFAVFRTEEATCFCLWSGALEITPTDTGEPIDLPVQMRVFVYKDGRQPEVQPISDMERMKLSMTHDAGLVDTPDSGGQ
jgi:ferric-dicitrate binding protein FerR (iron transport regulator)